MIHHSIELPIFLQQMSVALLEVPVGGEQGGFWEHILKSNVINIALVLFILGFLVKKLNLLSGIDTQQEKIATEVHTLEKRKREALAQLEETQRRTANLKSEIDAILSQARESAEALSLQILNEAKADSGRIVENARRRVALEQRGAIKDLEKRLLNDALQDARVELAQSLNAEQQKRSVETFLDELSAMSGGSNAGSSKNRGGNRS